MSLERRELLRGCFTCLAIGDRLLFEGDTLPTMIAASREAAQVTRWPGTINRIRTLGFSRPGDGGEAVWRRTEVRPVHPGWFRSADGTLWEIASAVLAPHMFGPCGRDDDYPVFADWAATAVALGRVWRIPRGDYVLNGIAPIRLTTSGVCEGVLEIPKANTACRVEFVRETPAGEALDIRNWPPLTRGGRAAAPNAAGRNLFISSTEILIERDGGASAPYYKQEFIRCRGQSGAFTTPLVCTYTDLGKVVITAHEPSAVVRVDGLRVRRSGAGLPEIVPQGAVSITRDNVILNDLQVWNTDPTTPLPVAVNIGYCADVTLNRPRIRGFDDVTNGLGYGLLFASTAGCTVNDPDIQDCREAIAGRHNVDLAINGGVCSHAIDDHWGNRMTVRGTLIRARTGIAAVSYAGYDIALHDLTIINGRGVLGIRADTPSLGGEVIIKNTSVRSRGETGGAFYFIGLTAPDGVDSPVARTSRPVLPDLISLQDGSIDTDVASTYLAYLGVVRSSHINWGRIEVIGKWQTKVTGDLFGVFMLKDARWQKDRAAEIIIDTPIDFGTGPAVFVSALDSSADRGATVKVANLAGGSIRYSPYGVSDLQVTGGRLGSVENDDVTEAPGASRALLTGVRMTGGYVRATLANMTFSGCEFTGAYDQFPASSAVTMINNTRAVISAAIPPDRRGS